jgi:hypothetical protein
VNLLGETRNMDEREEAGMKALTEGVHLDEEAGAAGAGMLVCHPLYHPVWTFAGESSIIVAGNLVHQTNLLVAAPIRC